MNLHTRIAEALGWKPEDVATFSLHALRDLVRPVSQKLVAEIDEAIRGGSYLWSER